MSSPHCEHAMMITHTRMPSGRASGGSWALLALASACAATVGCQRHAADVAEVVEVADAPASDTPAATEFNETTPGIGGAGMNVVLVSVDTTRADHLGCYGHPKIKTPNVDRLAAEGTRFAMCISSAPLTLPSHTTMMTGSYPFVHGARDNAIFIVPQENKTLAELFKDAGYSTHAEVAAVVLDDKYQLSQGFDTYGTVKQARLKINLHDSVKDLLSDSGDAIPKIDLAPPEVETDRKADDITARGIELLNEVAAKPEPFFLFLHYFDPHWPHEAPPRFADQYDDGYFAEIAFFDEQFGLLMDRLRELGLSGRTLVVLVSDHGEGRGQHGEYTHSTFLYDTTLHVPMIMWCPGQIPAGLVVESQVRLVDLAPTIADFARLPRTPQMQGTTLLPLVADPSLEVRLPCYSETMVPQNSLGYAPLRSYRTDQWKYILAPRPELYNLKDDLLEIFNLAGAKQDLTADMREQLWDLIADAPAAPGGRGTWQSPDADEVRKLAALGYVSGPSFQDEDLMSGSELDHFEPVGLNPKDRIEVIECWAAGLGAFRIGRYEDAERMYRRFVELEPEHHLGASYLGRCLLRQDRYDEAIPWLRRAVELDPTGYLDHRMLGTLLALKGETDAAMESYREAIKHNAEDAVSHLNLGMLLAIQDRFDLAIAQYDTGLKYAPDEAPLHFHRGLALKRTKRLPEAADEFAEALRLKPDYSRALEQLAVTKHQMGRSNEALELLNEAMDKDPGDATIYHALGQIYAAKGELDLAGENFARVVEYLPDNAVARQNYGTNLFLRGRADEAVVQLRKALELDASFMQTRFYLAQALEAAGDLDEAASTYEDLLAAAPRFAMAYPAAANLLAQRGDAAAAIALLRRGYELLPQNINVANDLAWQLATCPDDDQRDGQEAVRLAEYANALRGGERFNELDTLAAAYAEAGRFDEAVSAAEQALSIVMQTGQEEVIAEISARLELFRHGRPYRYR